MYQEIVTHTIMRHNLSHDNPITCNINLFTLYHRDIASFYTYISSELL